jgi:hypothetical protein
MNRSAYTKGPKAKDPAKRNPELLDDFVANALIAEAVEGANAASWKDIKPARTYMDIKKKAFIEQKKRDFEQMRDAKN